MRATKKELPVTMETKDLKIQEAEWGEMHVSFEAYTKRLDVTPLFKGLPNNMDQSPHWGYIFKGGYQVNYKDGRTERFKAGDVYYVEPGHGTIVEAGTELVEFSPKEALRKTMEVVGRNL